jgi:hypothetical protein
VVEDDSAEVDCCEACAAAMSCQGGRQDGSDMWSKPAGVLGWGTAASV